MNDADVVLRPSASDRRPASFPVWPAALIAVGLTLYVAAPRRDLFPMDMVTLIVFGAVMYLLPACRPTRRSVLSPLGWAIGLFVITMIVCPLLIAYLGPSRFLLPSLPSTDDLRLAIALTLLSFVAFSVGFTVLSRATWPWRRTRGWFPDPIPSWFPVAFACLGIVGFALSFRSLGNLTAYLTTPAARGEPTEDATYLSILGSILRPFLAFGVILAWCRWIDGARRSIGGALVRLSGVAVCVLLAYGTFSFNRAAIVYPLVALVAVFSRRVRRIGLLGLAVLMVLGIVILPLIGVYRSSTVTAREFFGASGSSLVRDQVDLNQEIQVYGAAPQFLAFVMTKADTMSLQGGRALFSSVISPVPKLGDRFREGSGTGIYNRWLYGTTGISDQVIPFAGELYIDFRAPGVAVGFALVGAVLAWFQAGFMQARTTLGSFVAQYAGMVFAFLIIGSALAVSQIFLYFFWPVYAIVAFDVLRVRSPTLPVSAGRSRTSV
jgi:hypothetical protein